MEAINEISMDGYQIVSGDYFTMMTRMSVPTLTLWDGSIGFSKQGILMLNSCENVLVQVNAKEKRILIVPSNSKDKDAVKWVKRLDPVEGRKIACKRLTENLYRQWNFDADYIYRSIGKLVSAGNKVMLLFDFSNAEKWKRPEAKNVK